MRQVYRRTKLQSNYIEITHRNGCPPVNLLHIFRTPFPKNTPGGLLLKETARKFQGLWLQKNFFSSVYAIATTCLDKCFLFII